MVRSYIPSPYQGGGEVLEAVGWGGERVFESREKAMAEAKTICKALEESKPRPVPSVRHGLPSRTAWRNFHQGLAYRSGRVTITRGQTDGTGGMPWGRGFRGV